MTYDDSNIFAKILRGEIPNNTVYEDDIALAFHDIAPQAPVHVVVISKAPYVDYADFVANATADEQAGFLNAIARTAEAAGVAESGYRLLANIGPDSGQEIPHLHFHICGGGPVGRLIARD